MVEYILGQQAKASAHVHTLRYRTMEDRTVEPKPGYTVVRTSTERSVAWSGKRMSVVSELNHTLTDGKNQKVSTRAVLNDAYLAVSINGASSLYEHQSIEQLTPSALNALRIMSGPDAIKDSFGDGMFGLSEWFGTPPKEAEWLVKDNGDQGDSREFVLRYFNQGKLYFEWHVAPNKGYVVTKLIRYSEGGEVEADSSVTPIWWGGDSGLWLAGTVTRVDYPIDDGKPNPHRQRSNTYAYRDMEVNPTLPERTFTVAQLKCKDGSLIANMAADGTSSPMAILDDKVVPVSVAAQFLGEQKRRAATKQAPAESHFTSKPTTFAVASDPDLKSPYLVRRTYWMLGGAIIAASVSIGILVRYRSNGNRVDLKD